MADVDDSLDDAALLAEYLKEEQVKLEVHKEVLQKKESFKTSEEDDLMRKEQGDPDDIIQQEQQQQQQKDDTVEIDPVEFDIMDLEGAPEEVQDKRRHTTSPPIPITKVFSSDYNKKRYKDTLENGEYQANTAEIQDWVKKSMKIPRKRENQPPSPSSSSLGETGTLSPDSRKRKQSYSETIIEECISEMSAEAQIEFFGDIRLREAQVQATKVEKIDPEFAKVKLRQAHIERCKSDSTDDGEALMGTTVPFVSVAEPILILSYRELVKKTIAKEYSGVDKISLEKSLSDEEFISVFMMDRETFYALPKWKREDAKKKLYLF